ncbi:UNVERIFIED_CONTAM: hypothetical protein Sangu_2860600 [Sesamum angustifolium]|uniref:Uncharacterized protein n=1 Tax=Sesamum angustifolium TaxID=2727405 RepID=A0AAW2INK7_9LAMI
MYAQVCKHSDIAYITALLGKYFEKSSVGPLKCSQKRTENCFTYQRIDQLEIIGYTDSNFVGCQDSMKPTSSYIYMLVMGAIYWKSAKQSVIAYSTMAATFVPCYEVYNHGIWLHNLVTGLCIGDIDRLSYFVTISLRCYTPTTIGAR